MKRIALALALATTLTAEHLTALTPAWDGATVDTLTPIVGKDAAHTALELSALLAAQCHTPAGALSMAALLRGRFGPLVAAWLESAAGNPTVRVAPVLAGVTSIKGKKNGRTGGGRGRGLPGGGAPPTFLKRTKNPATYPCANANSIAAHTAAACAALHWSGVARGLSGGTPGVVW